MNAWTLGFACKGVGKDTLKLGIVVDEYVNVLIGFKVPALKTFEAVKLAGEDACG